jgi:transcriptional regulator with XRE-family HTH domain
MNRGSQALARLSESERGYQSKLAEKSGISQSWLSRIAAGAKPNRTQSLILERLTGVPPAWYDQPAVEPEAKAG